MVFELDFSSEVPIYQQLRAALIQDMAAGRLVPGDSLPSVRQLSAELGINMHTVNKVYALLRQEGYLAMDRHRGATVRERPAADPVFLDRVQGQLHALAAEAKGHSLEKEAFLSLCAAAFDRL
jgi:GntR family transcriptional regulator